MLRKYLLSLCLAAVNVPSLHAQATVTASKVFDIQAGASFVGAIPDYSFNGSSPKYKGYGLYSSIGFLPHIGLELDFHQVNAPSPKIEYERTYEVGGRYVLHYGRLQPYAKLMYGRGVFNFPSFPTDTGLAEANLAYNLLGGGGGLDFRLKPYLNVRADYEYQKWFGDQFLLPNGISPQLFSIGAAYHFR
jgi:Outer membrane protein beta-barrel domain